jgi:4-amino-4-deoxychorismate lyase
MSLFIESIKLQNGEFRNLFYHEQRMNRSLKVFCGLTKSVELEKWLQDISRPAKGLYKCRIVYDEVSKAVEFIPYEPKPIQSLRIIEHNDISYEFKYLDRKIINQLYALRKDCDDILIVKNGLVTDSSYANIVFKKGKRWYTPRSALLKGTMRSKLVQLNMIREKEIGVEDIMMFEKFKLINAMVEFEAPEIAVSNIIY